MKMKNNLLKVTVLILTLSVLYGCGNNDFRSEIEYSDLQVGVLSDIKRDMESNDYPSTPTDLIELKQEIDAQNIAADPGVTLPTKIQKNLDLLQRNQVKLDLQRLEGLAGQSLGASMYAKEKLDALNGDSKHEREIYQNKIERELANVTALVDSIGRSKKLDFDELQAKTEMIHKTRTEIRQWGSVQGHSIAVLNAAEEILAAAEKRIVQARQDMSLIEQIIKQHQEQITTILNQIG
ncbi:hypothetical protein [Paenibacillus xylanilyticus]|uniref:Lipoprotein n=1 Tax=Paenibacillus xylanilyticus TaxID=248903 RepID=A0A7Y6BTF4_9BACL|nr:hypothetical protein [Paenibacillus xylanilyticus]NUU74627.1 hypothetical protein [Paenibacillus xylanilyticus]